MVFCEIVLPQKALLFYMDMEFDWLPGMELKEPALIDNAEAIIKLIQPPTLQTTR